MRDVMCDVFKTSQKMSLKAVLCLIRHQISRSHFVAKILARFEAELFICSQGLSRFAARSAVQTGLEALGLYRGWHPHPQVLPLCSRTDDLVEPLLRPQWYLRCSGEMAERALDAVATGALW